MADLNLLGYGPHTLAASNDYYVKCVGGAPKRSRKLVVSVNRTAGSLQFFSKGENADSDVALDTQSYTKSDETLASAALSADATVRIDATGKQIVVRTDASFAGDVRFDVEREM